MMAIGPGLTGLSYNQQGIVSVPHSSGVYALYTAQKWVYVGESDDIQRRLVEHVTTADTYITRQQPTGFMFELVIGVRGPAGATESVDRCTESSVQSDNGLNTPVHSAG